jgi:hypothetical protein
LSSFELIDAVKDGAIAFGFSRIRLDLPRLGRVGRAEDDDDCPTSRNVGRSRSAGRGRTGENTGMKRVSF